MKKHLTITLALAAGLTLASAPSASAEEFTCRRSVGAITVDNLRVPSGATCSLNGTTVKGTIKVESNATLRAEGVRVVGNVQAENASRVVIVASSRVGGSVQIVQGDAAKVANTRVNGDILYDDNSGLAEGTEEHGRWQRAGVPEHGRRGDPREPDRRQPPVQGEHPSADRRRQHRRGQQGRPVRASVTEVGIARRHARGGEAKDTPRSRGGRKASLAALSPVAG